MTQETITSEELRWALECLTAGDTLAEVADWSDRSVDDWTAALASAGQTFAVARAGLDPRDLTIAAGYDAGLSDVEIAGLIGVSATRVRQLTPKLIGRGVIQKRDPGFASSKRGRQSRAAFLSEVR